MHGGGRHCGLLGNTGQHEGRTGEGARTSEQPVPGQEGRGWSAPTSWGEHSGPVLTRLPEGLLDDGNQILSPTPATPTHL